VALNDQRLKFVELLARAALAAEPHLGRDAVSGILFSVAWGYVRRDSLPAEAEEFFRQQIAKLRADTPLDDERAS